MPSVTRNSPCLAQSWACRHRLGLTVSGQWASRYEYASRSHTTLPLESVMMHGSRASTSPRSALSKSVRSLWSRGMLRILSVAVVGRPGTPPLKGGHAEGILVGDVVADENRCGAMVSLHQRLQRPALVGGDHGQFEHHLAAQQMDPRPARRVLLDLFGDGCRLGGIHPAQVDGDTGRLQFQPDVTVLGGDLLQLQPEPAQPAGVVR